MSGITIVLTLLSGVALFLFGMSLMGDGLKKVAGNKLEKILYKLIDYWYNTVVCVRYSAYGLNLKEVFTGLLLGFGANIKMR